MEFDRWVHELLVWPYEMATHGFSCARCGKIVIPFNRSTYCAQVFTKAASEHMGNCNQ